MARCIRKSNLDVYPISRSGDNGLSNAKVLCRHCHENTFTFGLPGFYPKEFSDETKKTALHNAGDQCECTSTSGCHKL